MKIIFKIDSIIGQRHGVIVHQLIALLSEVIDADADKKLLLLDIEMIKSRGI